MGSAFQPPSGFRDSAKRALGNGEVIASTYQIRDEITRTDTGVVFEARDMLLDRLVAFKLAWRDPGTPPLLSEARRCAAVRDPCAVAIYGMGSHNGAEYVVGDSDRLEQALQNLAANALRHTPADGEILLRSSIAPDGSMLIVRDTGPGIPAEHLPLIFDRFYKVDAARKAAGGSGLGLSIVKAIVERHGGRISARNDNGAVFEILLPSHLEMEARR